MRMAQSGQLRGRVSEQQLIDLLDQVRAPRRLSLRLAQHAHRSTGHNLSPHRERAQLWYVPDSCLSYDRS